MSVTMSQTDLYDLREAVDLRRTDAQQYGGKAATLGDVQRCGFAVPQSLAVPIAAYTDFVHDNQLDDVVAARAEESAAATPARLSEIEDEIGTRFGAAVVRPTLQEQVLSWAARCGITTLAVRSSATNEDLEGATFAGQYHSCLNVPRSSLSEAIRRCFASLFSARAGLYRRRKQIHGIGAMAILIQEMLSTDRAGVVFTRAPHHPDQMLLEVVSGLCEGAVSGTVSPNRYYLDRETLTVRRASERQECDMAQVRTVARQAMALEVQLGGPQDIEFGLVNGAIYILQARPVAA
jgi:phosphoenolpyruvate synthase/pyruvate phosphate dikinase